MQPGLKSQVLLSIGIHRIVQWRGFTWWGPGLGTEVPQWGSRSKAPVEGLGDFVPQKLKQNVKLAYNF